MGGARIRCAPHAHTPPHCNTAPFILAMLPLAATGLDSPFRFLCSSMPVRPALRPLPACYWFAPRCQLLHCSSLVGLPVGSAVSVPWRRAAPPPATIHCFCHSPAAWFFFGYGWLPIGCRPHPLPGCCPNGACGDIYAFARATRPALPLLPYRIACLCLPAGHTCPPMPCLCLTTRYPCLPAPTFPLPYCNTYAITFLCRSPSTGWTDGLLPAYHCHPTPH